MITATLLSIGDEILLGDTLDTNSSYLAKELRSLSILVKSIYTLGDDLKQIIAGFTTARAESDLVFSTGGLGPTADDLTVEALGLSLESPLEFQEEVLTAMMENFKRSRESLNAGNRKQAYLPRGAVALRNNWGTAPGIYFPLDDGRKKIFCMPGVPREMRMIFTERVIPLLRPLLRPLLPSLLGTTLRTTLEGQPDLPSVLIKSFNTFGLPESVLGERIHDLMQSGKNPDVGTRCNNGGVVVRAVAQGFSNHEITKNALDLVSMEIRAKLGPWIYGEDDITLPMATVQALVERKKTVSFAESCTAGLAAAKLSEVPGASQTLLAGVITYSNESKQLLCNVKSETLKDYGAVSAQVAEEMAAGIRVKIKSDFAIGITGIAGPGGGSLEKPVGLVYFALATQDKTFTFERRYFALDRATLRERAALQALEFLRRIALGLELDPKFN